MDRKKFIKKMAMGSISTALGTSVLKANDKIKGVKDPKPSDVVGFNHLPNKEIRTMKTVFHKASSRGHANHGWLDTHHTFSFANYYNPDRVHFGMLRVLNDDKVAPGRGFGKHPHDNMEIISIPLEGDLEHKDSMGNTAVIKQGEIQVMSAGTGVFHSEYNRNKDKDVKFLQIWIFPNRKNATPRYDQIEIAELLRPNKFSQILSPHQDDQGVWIHQNAWFHLGQFDKSTTHNYKINQPGNGVYAFMIDGEAEINSQKLAARDGFGIWDADEFEISTKPNTKMLLMELPMH